MFACGVLSVITLDQASSLPGVIAQSQGVGSGLSEPVRARAVQPYRRHGYRRPYYAPYFCSRPYQYRYWQFYAPICYPL